MWPSNDLSSAVLAGGLPTAALPPLEAWWGYALAAGALAAVAAGLWTTHRNLARERMIAERERMINRDLQELAELKDLLLADRAADITDRERLIAELQARNVELASFNYTVSHDLKNPLVTIKAYVGLVRKDAAAGKLERMLHDIDRIGCAADRMHQLLDDLLDLSRVGGVQNPPEELSMSELAHQAATGCQATEAGVRVDIPDDLPVVRGDRKQLREVFQNLIENAVIYMGKQPSPRIEVGARDLRGRDGSVEPTVFYVRDNGSGIDPPYHDKIFGLFERLDVSTEGTGLGLALVKRIVEVHGGRVWVESEGDGRGSTFCFTLSGPSPSR